jgi:hypothetical protein
LARDKEVVAVGLKFFTNKCVVHISKNKNWNDKDVEYINKIERYFKFKNLVTNYFQIHIISDNLWAKFKISKEIENAIFKLTNRYADLC